MTEARQLKCKSCGAPLDFKEGENTIKCPFCGTTTVLESREEVIDADRPEFKIEDVFQAVTPEKTGFKSCLWEFFLYFCVPASILVLIIFLALNKHWLPYYRAKTWNGESTFVCGGNFQLKLRGRKADITGAPAIKVEGFCSLTCEDCDLKGETAIEIHDNATVECNNCNLTGDEVGVFAKVNGRVKISGGSVAGVEAGVRLEGNGALDASSATISGDVGIDSENGANSQIKLKDVTVAGKSIAIELGSNSGLNAGNTTVRAPVGIRASGNSNVTYRGGSVEATNNAVEQRGNARLEFKNNPRVTGGIQAQRRNRIEGLE